MDSIKLCSNTVGDSKMKIKIGDVIEKCVFNGHWHNEPVAVKRMKLGERSATIKKQELTVDIYPNVVSLLCKEDVKGFRYYAMQLCKSTLQKSLSESDCYMGPLPIPEDILCQLADGLEYLHAKKLFHGNLKPSNALVYINPTDKGREAIMKWSLPGLSTKPMKEKQIYAMGFGDLETSELSFDELCLADVFAEGVTFAYFLSEGKYQLDSKPSHPHNVAVINKIHSPEARTLILKMLSENLKDRISSSDVAKELRRIKEKLGEDLKVLRDDSSTVASTKQKLVLGTGGYSQVYEGIWRRQRVAIKRIETITNAAIIIREEILTKLEHPNVIPMYAILNDENFRYFVMELCVASLDKLFKNEKGYNGPKLEDMPPPEDVFLQLAEGMSYIHKLNLSHRDIKPANVLICVKQGRSNQRSNNVILKWGDFGGSKKVNMEGEGSMSDFKFSYNWCSPEVLEQFTIRYDSTDATKFHQNMMKSDIFSEGLVFAFYLLEGEHLYGSSTETQDKQETKKENLSIIEEKHKQLSIVIKTMLMTEPNLRPSSQDVTEKIASIKSSKEKAPVNPSKPQFDSNAIIGKGTSSTVYLGKFGPEGFKVAVKKIIISERGIWLDETQENEIKELILNLSHQNIVRLYDVLNDGNNVWLFTMEYCIASMDHIFLPPEDRQKYNGPLPNRGEVLIQLASGLEYIHSSGFFHGNIKPRSVLIANINNKITMKWGNFKMWQTLRLGSRLGYDLSSQKVEMEFELKISRRRELHLRKKLEELSQRETDLRIELEELMKGMEELKEMKEQMKKWEKLEKLRDRKFHLRKKLETLKKMEELEEHMKKREKLEELSQRETDLRIELMKGMEELKEMKEQMKKWEKLEELRDRTFHLREKLETLKKMEELEEHMKKREKLEELSQREIDLRIELEVLEIQMKKRGREDLEELEELSQREFDLQIELEELKGMEELKKMRDLCKAGDLFKYYLLRGKTSFENLEREPFDDLKVSSINYLNQLILEMVLASVSSSEVVERLQSMKKEMDDKFANLLTTNPPNLEEIKSIMVEGIVDINCLDKNGYTPLLRLIQMSKGDYLLEVISLLLEHGVDVNHKDKDGWNALYFLCHYHQQKDNLIEIIKLLIKNGIDVKWKPHNENNILHFYCKNYKGEPFIDIVEIFLKKGVEMVFDGVDARNLVNNPKYPTRKNAKAIIDLMKNMML